MNQIIWNIPVRRKKLSGVARTIADMLTRFLWLCCPGPQVFSNVVWKGGSYGQMLKVVFDGPLHLSSAKIVQWYSRIPRTNLKLLQLWPLIFCQGRSFKKISATPFKKKRKVWRHFCTKKWNFFEGLLWIEAVLPKALAGNGPRCRSKPLKWDLVERLVLWRRAMNMIVVIKLSAKRN